MTMPESPLLSPTVVRAPTDIVVDLLDVQNVPVDHASDRVQIAWIFEQQRGTTMAVSVTEGVATFNHRFTIRAQTLRKESHTVRSTGSAPSQLCLCIQLVTRSSAPRTIDKLAIDVFPTELISGRVGITSSKMVRVTLKFTGNALSGSGSLESDGILGDAPTFTKRLRAHKDPDITALNRKLRDTERRLAEAEGQLLAERRGSQSQTRLLSAQSTDSQALSSDVPSSPLSPLQPPPPRPKIVAPHAAASQTSRPLEQPRECGTCIIS
eukprot:TRINITY_DN4714_c0_g1_i1.p1 TRINITY_DN4714_c0_g1~~TRINITY_DN4714_c0_g1_i1.p1  ORF type:complete len:277 (-),score=40.57 TRINITY_DN4714_c0_g1_i1:65-865(-)